MEDPKIELSIIDNCIRPPTAKAAMLIAAITTSVIYGALATNTLYKLRKLKLG